MVWGGAGKLRYHQGQVVVTKIHPYEMKMMNHKK